MSELTIPVAKCDECKIDVPVHIIDDFKLDGEEVPEELRGSEVTLVICSVCSNVLNNQAECTIGYFTEEDLKKIGWTIDHES